MNQLSDRLNRLSPSATLAMSQKSSELKAQDIDIINLSVGEPDFNTPDHIKAAAIKAVEDNFSRYSPVPGYPALRNAIVAKLKNENGLDYTPAQILCSNGAKQSVCNAIMALVNAGDEVIIPAPYWVSYPQMVKLAEGEPVIIEAGIEQDFKITPAQLEAAITPKTRALILCSPSNPTGSVYSKEELKGLAETLDVQYSVQFVPPQQGLKAVYQHAQLYAMSSRAEGFPMVLLEAMASGLPVVSFSCTGPDVIVRDGVDGFLVKQNYTDRLAAKMAELMKDDEKRRQFGARAREVTQRFSLEKYLDAYETLCKEAAK